MAKVNIIMPKMGESVAEATIIKWVKNIGDSIEVDETLVEIATDKVDSEIPSITKGILLEKLYEKDDVVKVGEVIAIIEDDKIDTNTSNTNKTELTEKNQTETAHMNHHNSEKDDNEKYAKELLTQDTQLNNLTNQKTNITNTENLFFATSKKHSKKREHSSIRFRKNSRYWKKWTSYKK